MNYALLYLQKLSRGELDAELLKLDPKTVLSHVIENAFTPMGCSKQTLEAIAILVNIVVAAERQGYTKQLEDLEERIDSLEDEKTCRMLEEVV